MADTGHEEARRNGRKGWAALLLGTALVLPGCGNEEPVVVSPRAANLPTQEVTDFSLRESDTGRPEWILVSKYAATYSNRGLIVAKDVAIDFYDSEGRKYSRLRP